MSAIDQGKFDSTALEALSHIEELDALARSAGTMLLVFHIPFASDVGDYPVCRYSEDTCERQRRQNPLGEALAEWARNRGIRFIDPVARFRKLEAAGQQLYFPLDAHWNSLGHGVAAELILGYLADESSPVLLAGPKTPASTAD